MLCRGDDLGVRGHDPHGRTATPPDVADDRPSQLSDPAGEGLLVEPREEVADSHVAYRAPGEVGVKDGRLGREAVGAAVLTAAVGVQAEAEPDVGARVLRQD